MSELKPRITENGIDYILVGDYYLSLIHIFSNPRMFAGYGRQKGWERDTSGNELPSNEGGFVELPPLRLIKGMSQSLLEQLF